MTLEEKAKAYDEAIEKARQLCAYPTTKPFISDLKDIFPKLKESEDERIRSALLRGFNSMYANQAIPTFAGEPIKDILAWLEKQGMPAKYHDICDTCVRQPTCQSDCFLQQDEQKPTEEVDLPEFESYLCLMLQKFRTKGMCTNGEIIDYVEEHSQKLRDILVRPAWSEEDEDYYDAIITKLEVTKDDALLTDNQMEFLKSLKDRVLPKNEWSEEDKEYIKSILEIINGTPSLTPSEIECHKDWLKSLRPQSQWKPSKEQMCAVHIAAEVGTSEHSWTMCTLKELYKQLKEL